MRRAFFFSLDALLATILIVTAVVLYTQLHAASPDTTPSTVVGEDVLASLGAITLEELEPKEPWITDLYNDTVLNENDTVLYAAGLLWVLNDTRLDNLTRVINGTVPDRYGLRLAVEDETIYDQPPPTQPTVVSTSRQQITGIDRGKPVAGSSSSAYLKKLRNKQTSTFAYYGGFAGQGNITTTLPLPSDVNSSRVISFFAELDTPSTFEVHVNDTKCAAETPTTDNMTPDRFNLSSCIDHLGAGNNTVQLRYSDVSEAYVAGGYLKATYTTDEFTSQQNLSRTTYRFPEILGVVNLYDSFVIPQSLKNLTVRLHYDNPDEEVYTYLSIGEKRVYNTNRTGDVDVTLTDDNLSILDYDFLSNKTVPIRFASYNTTTGTVQGSNADVVLVTDYSGSMKKDIDSWGQGNSGDVEQCETQVYPDDDIRRTHLARCLDKEVIEVLFNYTGNRLWPVHYVDDELHRYTNPEDPEALTEYYETYTETFPQQGKGKTCIACALSEAYSVFEDNPEPDRGRFVILMSDGLPTHCTGEGCSERSAAYGSLICEGLCDVPGQSCNDFGDMCTDSSCDPAISNAEAVAQDLKDDYNATIYTVGYGPMQTCSKAAQLLQTLADITNGTYQNSSDPQALKDIYRNISREIVNSVEQESQNVVVGGNVTTSSLYGDSYIRAVHDPVAQDTGQNEIEVTRQTPQFNSCTPTVDLPSGVRYRDAHVLSYSGPHWTDLLTINGEEAYNLSNYLVNYTRLGDPYRIHVPADNLAATNDVLINTGDSEDNSTGCSDNNTMVYTAFVPSTTTRTPVLEAAEGCEWTIETEEQGTQTVTIPDDYAGANTCEYTNASISYNESDTMQLAVHDLLASLDFDGDGRVFVSLEAEDLEIVVTDVGSVPYMWGPIMLTAEVRQ